jgi:AraC-like DNA-binding protein/quercetin dioxygenase-like cupin family protein
MQKVMLVYQENVLQKGREVFDMLDMDLRVLRIVKLKYLQGCYIDKHRHDFFQYIHILNGCGKISIATELYHAKQGETYLVPNGVEHQIISNKEKGFETVDLKFKVNNLAVKEDLMKLPYRFTNESINKSIYILIENIINELLHKKLYYKEVVQNKIEILLLYILRDCFLNNEVDVDNNINNETIQETIDFKNDPYKLLDYINNNVNIKIPIYNLAKINGFNEAYFCTLFKEKFGMSPLQYINVVKINKAKEYILNSNLNISQIAYKIGFDNLHYFSRIFKKIVHISPSEYLKQMRGNIIRNIYEDDASLTENNFIFPQKKDI